MSLGQVREFRFSSWSALVVEAILAVLTYGFAIQEGWSHPVPWILMLVAIGLLPFFVLCHLNRRLVISEEGLADYDYLGRLSTTATFEDIRRLEHSRGDDGPFLDVHTLQGRINIYYLRNRKEILAILMAKRPDLKKDL
jgi:hypothetical protein